MKRARGGTGPDGTDKTGWDRMGPDGTGQDRMGTGPDGTDKTSRSYYITPSYSGSTAP